MAEMIAQISGKKVLLEQADEAEKASYNPVTKSVLDSSKLEGLGWNAKYDMKTGLQKTIQILMEKKYGKRE
jgi:nucleoside-diphosphate-sugar epimerase